jgi:hypothetical protein
MPKHLLKCLRSASQQIAKTPSRILVPQKVHGPRFDSVCIGNSMLTLDDEHASLWQ